MTQRSQIWTVIGVGVAGMFAAEVAPGWFSWMPPLAIGILRAYIIIHGPDIRERLGPDEGHAMASQWTWGTTTLVAAYVGVLWYRDVISDDLGISLQVVNILLVGAEIYYSHLKRDPSDDAPDLSQALADSEAKVETISDELRKKSQSFEDMREQFETASRKLADAEKVARMAGKKSLAMSRPVAVDKYYVRFCPTCARANRWTKKKESHRCECGRELCE